MSGSPGEARPRQILVVGAGLIGTSAALALSGAGWTVWLDDRDQQALRLALDLGAGQAGVPQADPTVVLVAVSPRDTGQVVAERQRQYVNSIFSDVASIKSQVEADIERLGADTTRFVGGHPLAGRERSGPGAGRADLFEGRPWVLTVRPDSTAAAVETMRELVLACGAQPVVVPAGLHDKAVALVSHMPQVMASLTAARLVDADRELLDLAGQGLRDMTRIADSDASMWAEILGANAAEVLAVLDPLSADLELIREDLRALLPVAGHKSAEPGGPGDGSLGRSVDKSAELPFVRELIVRGNAGRGRLPGKHGAAPVHFTVVPVVVSDRPGELARLLVASGDAGINVEDVSIEHSPGQPVGLVELSVRPEVAVALARALRSAGWSVHA